MSLRLHLCVLPIRLAAGGCIGRRFFQGSSQAALLGELRQKIQEVSNFHYTASQALRVPPPHTPSTDSQGSASPENPLRPYLTSPQLHTELVRYLLECILLPDRQYQPLLRFNRIFLLT